MWWSARKAAQGVGGRRSSAPRFHSCGAAPGLRLAPRCSDSREVRASLWPSAERRPIANTTPRPSHAEALPLAQEARTSCFLPIAPWRPSAHPVQKIRADWSKETLYNISRVTVPSAASKTFFQQKWNAKALTRAYHGEQIREKQWQHMFRRTLPAVVPMDHKYLARTDGSEEATGRGSGEDEPTDIMMRRKSEMTPYMQMTFYPVERRLDTAIWRALFASSARQARQFVVHGWVKVNGKKVCFPLLQDNQALSADPLQL